MTDPSAAPRPGSAGEHALQEAHGTAERARRFYDEQMVDHLTGPMTEFVDRMAMMFVATADAVSALDEACSSRQWWPEQWPGGAEYVAGLVAQDVQDALFDNAGRWPLCLECDSGPVHSLYIQPDLGGPDPVWVCEETGEVAALLGFLQRRS